MVDSAKKYISKYIIFPPDFVGQGVQNIDPNVWLDRARPPPKSTGKFSRVEH
jgi:hypothetical protein